MKIYFAILALLFSITANSASSIDPTDIVVVEDVTNETILLRTTVPVLNDTQLYLLDKEGGKLYEQTLPAGSYLNKRFRGASFPEGDFELIIQDQFGQTKIPFSYREKSLNVLTEAAHRTIYPLVNLNEEQLLTISYPNTSGKRVNVRLINADGNAVFTDRLEGAMIKRAYRLSNLAAGKYVITVSSHSLKNYSAAIALR